MENDRNKSIKPKAGFLKDKQNRQTSGEAHQEEKREDPNKQNKKWKRRNNKWYCRNTKKHKRILWTITHQQIGQPRRHGQVSRNIQPTKSESRINR